MQWIMIVQLFSLGLLNAFIFILIRNSFQFFLFKLIIHFISPAYLALARKKRRYPGSCWFYNDFGERQFLNLKFLWRSLWPVFHHCQWPTTSLPYVSHTVNNAWLWAKFVSFHHYSASLLFCSLCIFCVRSKRFLRKWKVLSDKKWREEMNRNVKLVCTAVVPHKNVTLFLMSTVNSIVVWN